MIIPFKKQNKYYGFLILLSIPAIIVHFHQQIWAFLIEFNSMRLMIATGIISLLYVLLILFVFPDCLNKI